jgi:hypothetical protein
VRRRHVSALALLVLAGALACGSGSKKDGANGRPCAAASDCGALVCLAGKCVASGPAAASCSPPSRPSLSLGDPMTAADPGTTCETPIRSPVIAGAQSLGELQVGQQMQFQVPAGTWSVTIVSQEVADSASDTVVFLGSAVPNSVVPTSVVAPDGTVFFDDLAPVPRDSLGYPDLTQLFGYYGGFTPVSGALTLPNTTPSLDVVRSAGELPAGTWRLTVNDFAFECGSISGCSTGSPSSGRYDVRVLTRPGPITSTGTLDLDVYFASADLTAAQAVGDPQVERLFQSIATVLGNAGICLGRVVLHDLPQWARDRYSIVNVDSIGPCDPLSQLFTLALAQSSSVHLFLVDDLQVTDDGDPFQIAGIDGSIPGPSGVPGTVNGGAVATLANLGQGTCGSALDLASCGTDHLAFVLAHEVGHWLGLYHPTERSGTLFDPLADTPTCACAACAPMVEQASCADKNPPGPATDMIGRYCASNAATCSGASNLMFWLLDDERSNGSVTAQQAEVMRLNPAVH